MALPRRLLLLLVFLVVIGPACVSPEQHGGVVVQPGASERAMLLMRYGFLRLGDSEGSAEAMRIARDELLPHGRAATARIGDYMLENNALVAVVGEIDGTTRGGRLVDMWRKPAGLDGLDDHETFVFGRLVTYETLRTGFDVGTGAAYIEVSAVIDRSSEGLPVVSVATRYDLAPAIDAVLAHTQVKVIRGEVDPGEPRPLVAERLRALDAAEATVDDKTATTIGEAQGYLLHPLTAPAELGADSTMARVSVPASPPPHPGAAFLFSRLCAPPERPGALALAVALARIEGAEVGEVRVQLVGGGRQLTRLGVGDVVLRRPDGSEVVARGALPCPPESAYVVYAPEGTYALGFRGALHEAVPSRAVTVGGEGAAATLEVAPGSAPSYRAPPRAWRCREVKEEPLP